MGKFEELTKDLSSEDRLALVGELVGRSQANKEKVKKNYINRTAAEYAFAMNMNPETEYGDNLSEAYMKYYHPEKLEKAIGDFTGADAYLANLTTWNRNDLLTGARAKEFWDLIFDYSSDFVKKITFKVGDELTYPLDIWASIEENLISSLRAGEQPTAAELKDQVGKIGK